MKVLLRPIFMFAEPIVLFTDLFIVLLYSLFFLYFESYPIIFKGWCLRKQLSAWAVSCSCLYIAQEPTAWLKAKPPLHLFHVSFPTLPTALSVLIRFSWRWCLHSKWNLSMVWRLPRTSQKERLLMGKTRKIPQITLSLRRRTCICDIAILAGSLIETL